MDISKEKLVSCIIPSYNRQDLLRRALESVISQTYKNIEIIVVDDASQDNTEFVVREYMEKDKRIKYVKNSKPLGGSGARNVGIRMAKGAYIAFLDDDDEWVGNKIEAQIKAIKACDGVLCAGITKSKKSKTKYNKLIVDSNDLKKGTILGGGSSLLVRSSVVKDSLFDEKLIKGQDWDLLIRISRKYKIGFLNQTLVICDDGEHIRITNETINMAINQLEKRLAVVYKHKHFFGPYWFDYHIASRLLSYIKLRDGKIKHIAYTIKRCGFFAVLRVFLDKIFRNVNRI